MQRTLQTRLLSSYSVHSFWNQTSCINWQGAGSRDEPVDSRRLGGKTPVTMGAFLEGHLSRWPQETGWLVRTWKQGKWRCSGIATSVCSIDECVCVESPSRYHLASGQSGSSTGWRAGQKRVSSLCMIPHPPAESSALELVPTPQLYPLVLEVAARVWPEAMPWHWGWGMQPRGHRHSCSSRSRRGRLIYVLEDPLRIGICIVHSLVFVVEPVLYCHPCSRKPYVTLTALLASY